MIEVRKLVKRFGLKTVLRGLDFHVEPGEFVAILGPNGAGKTTFLRILSSLSRDLRWARCVLPVTGCQPKPRTCADAWGWYLTCPCCMAI